MAYERPFIAWNDLILAATIAATSEDGDNIEENVQDYRRSTFWKGTGIGGGEPPIILTATFAGGAQDFDTCIIMAHDLHTQGATVHFERFNGGGWSDIVAPFAPTDDRLILLTFATVNDSAVRLNISGYSNPPSIGVWHVCERMTFPRFLQADFDPDKHTVNLENQVSRAGELLTMTRASTLRQITANFKKIPDSWITSDFKPFWAACVNAANPRPFFFAWEPGIHSVDCVYAWVDKPQWDAPYNDMTRSIGLDLMGLWEL
jgi:hypothetical protein